MNAPDTPRQPDAISDAIVSQRPELAGQVHYVNGRAWCDGINHTTMCDPASEPHPAHDPPAAEGLDLFHAVSRVIATHVGAALDAGAPIECNAIAGDVLRVVRELIGQAAAGCQTCCDPGCSYACHEAHAGPSARSHDPAACIGTITSAAIWAERARSAEQVANLKKAPSRFEHLEEVGQQLAIDIAVKAERERIRLLAVTKGAVLLLPVMAGGTDGDDGASTNTLTWETAPFADLIGGQPS